MNIQSMQFAQGLLGAVEGKSNAGKGIASAASDAVSQATHLPEAKDNKISSDKSSLLGNAIDIYYPPFFPVGKTQEIFSAILETTNIGRPPSEAVQAVKQESKETADAGQQQMVKEKVESVNDNAPQEAAGSGSVLDLKV